MNEPSDDERLLLLADAVADGFEVDWANVEASTRDPEHREVIEQLRFLSHIVGLHRTTEQTVPRSWGPLEVRDELGRGTFGTVYRAWDPKLDREVALKLLHPTASEQPEVASAIIEEGRLLARIRHANVVTIYGADRFDGRVGLWMEFVRGKTLKQSLEERGPLGARETALIGADLCRALAAVHKAGLVHRDVKAQNVIQESGGRLVLMDFGAGREAFATRGDGLTSMAGTPLYMSPELLDGAEASAESDVYSLGVLLFHMVTGSFPVSGNDLEELRRSHAQRRPGQVRSLRPDLPSSFVRVVEQATSPSPADRFATAGAMETALDVSLSIGTIDRRRWLSSGLAAAIVAALVALVPIGQLAWRRYGQGLHASDRAPVVAVLPFSDDSSASGDSSLTGLADIISAQLSTLPGIVVIPPPQMGTSGLTNPAPALRGLGLDYVFAGTGSHDGAKRVVSLKFVNPSMDVQKATHKFETADASVFRLQQEITEWVIAQIKEIAITPVTTATSGQITANIQAFEDYSQGRQFLERRDVDGNIERAIIALQRAISRDPHFALAYAALGEAHWQQYQKSGDPVAAEGTREATLEALRLQPNQPMVRYSLALLYQGTGRRREAIEELQKAITLQPSNDRLHRLLGQVYGDDGRTDQAIGELLAAIRLRPGFWDNYRALGLAYYDAGRYRDAISALSRLTELQPDSASGFQMLGTSYHAVGDLDHALENYRRANAIKPSATAWSNIGTIHYRQRKFADAVTAYRESIRLQPREPATHRNLGDALSRLADPAAARAAYQAAVDLCEVRLQIERKDARTLALEALCLAKMSNFAAADRLIETAIAINPSASTIYQECVISSLAHRDDAALESLRRAIDKGYSAVLAAEDDDLVALHQHPAFFQIVGRRERRGGQ